MVGYKLLVRIFSDLIMTPKKLLWLLPLSFILWACPYESKVPLTPAPSEPVDSSLMGYWYGIIKDGSDFFGIEALEITAKSDSVYAIIRYGKALKGDIILPDTSYFTGYTTYIGEQQFMSLEGSVTVVTTKRGKQESKKERIYYLSAMERRNDTLTIRTISENFTTNKNFRNPDELKLAVINSTKEKKNIFDETYSLSYRKIPKPPPLKPYKTP